MPQWLDNLMTGQKAIPNVPWLRDIEEIVTLKDPTAAGGPATRSKPPIGQREAARHLQAFGGKHDAIDWVMNCVSLIAETAANASYHWEKDGEVLVPRADKTNPQSKTVAPDLLIKLFERPNPYQDYVEFFELLIIDLLLVGNAYWLKYQTNAQGQPLALYRLAPPYVKVQPGPYGVTSYEYKVVGQQDPLVLSPEQVVHFKRPNPHSSYLGQGVIQGGARVMDLELALTDTQASYYEKHAQPSGVIQSDRPVPKTTFRKIQQQIRSRIGGSDKAGELLVLEAGLKYQSISPNAVEAAFESVTNLSRNRICAMFRTPLSLLGIIDNQNLKIADAQRVFDTKTMRPLLNKLQNCISYGITEAWGLDFKIEYEYIMPAEDKLKLTSQFSALPGVTVDEIRDYAGLPPSKDRTIGEMVLNLPGQNGVPGATRNGFPDPNLAGEPGRPPIPVNTNAFPTNGAPLPAGAAARRPSEKQVKAMDPDEAAARLDAILNDRDWDAEGQAVEIKAAPELPAPQPDPFNPPADTLYDRRTEQVDAIAASERREIDDAVHYLERGLLDAAAGKATGLRQRILDSPAWAAFSQRLSDILERHAARAIDAAAIHEANRAGQPVELDSAAIAREVVYRPEGLRKIIANLRRSLSTRVQRAEQRSSDVAEVEKVLREAMDAWRTGHSETVALSETVEAYNEGGLSAYEANGGASVYVTDGHDFDTACAEADGSVWPIAKARANRKGHPRCVRAFIPAEA